MAVIGHPVTIHDDGNITLFYGIQREVRTAYTTDQGARWNDLRTIATSPAAQNHNWQVATTDPDGVLSTLRPYGGQDGRSWGVYLIQLNVKDHLTLKSWTGPLDVDRPSSWNSSANNVDNYGGNNDDDADGSIWVAWSDTREGAPQIRVARLQLDETGIPGKQ